MQGKYRVNRVNRDICCRHLSKHIWCPSLIKWFAYRHKADNTEVWTAVCRVNKPSRDVTGGNVYCKQPTEPITLSRPGKWNSDRRLTRFLNVIGIQLKRWFILTIIFPFLIFLSSSPSSTVSKGCLVSANQWVLGIVGSHLASETCHFFFLWCQLDFLDLIILMGSCFLSLVWSGTKES